MIGNDIVDLAQAKQESKWQRRGFLGKVFTDYEQHLIHTALNSNLMVWLLWSMKESAYKLSVRHTYKREYAPRKIACFPDESDIKVLTGRVIYEQETYATQSIITSNYIATVAFRAGTSPVYQHRIIPFDKPDYLTQHYTIRKHIQQDCAAWLGISRQSICFHKNEAGIPHLTAGNLMPISLTISHHGHYGSYGILL